MTEQVWNFAGIEGGASEIRAPSVTTAGLLDEGKASLAALAAVWGGSGSEAYQAVQMRWDSTSNELNSALQNLAHDHQRSRCDDGSDRSRRHRDVRLTRRCAQVGGLGSRAASPTACVSASLTIERYPCRPTMTGSSTSSGDAVQTADDEAGDRDARPAPMPTRWTGPQRSDAARDARRPPAQHSGRGGTATAADRGHDVRCRPRATAARSGTNPTG